MVGTEAISYKFKSKIWYSRLSLAANMIYFAGINVVCGVRREMSTYRYNSCLLVEEN